MRGFVSRESSPIHHALASVATILVVASVAIAQERLPYNHPGLTVDLGVGLWSWPMPVDYDGDGDLDLLMSGFDSGAADRTSIMRNDAGTFNEAQFWAARPVAAGQDAVLVLTTRQIWETHRVAAALLDFAAGYGS